MAGVFDIDLDQPEETVSDDELEEVMDTRFESERRGSRYTQSRAQALGPINQRRAASCYASMLTSRLYSGFKCTDVIVTQRLTAQVNEISPL